jgi:small-conductance mechanosensitive channel
MPDSSFLDQIFLGRTVLAWLTFAATWLALTLVLMLARRIAVRYVGRFSSRTENRADDIALELIRGLRLIFLAAAGLYATIAIHGIPIPNAGAAMFLVALVQIGLSLNDLGRLTADWYIAAAPEDQSRATAVNAIRMAARLVAWGIIVVLALDTLGLDVTALATGLGVGGIAVALAVQNVLKDILAYASILFDRPFVNGDFLVVGDLSGTVEQIGIKTTRLRSLSGEELIFTNTDLLESRIRNYRRMYERRIVFGVGVEYDTPAADLEAIPGIIRSAIESQEDLRFDRAHLKAFDDSAVGFEAVYYVLKPAYAAYMDAQQAINLSIYRAFAAAGIAFAFPTQTLHVASFPGDSDLIPAKPGG